MESSKFVTVEPLFGLDHGVRKFARASPFLEGVEPNDYGSANRIIEKFRESFRTRSGGGKLSASSQHADGPKGLST
jgi:hypothetical protein